MTTEYMKADRSVHKYVTDIAYEFHAPLAEAGVTIGVLFAFPDLEVRGMPAHAYIKITGKRERALGNPDATVVIHRESWDEMDDARRRALIDHEAAHLIVCMEDDGKTVKLDDNGRPRLKMRKHDAEIGFFFDVIERHREAAVESKQFVDLTRRMHQLEFPWGMGR